MSATINLNGIDYAIANPIDISIPLNFTGLQPNAYGVEPATSKPCEAGDLVGDTRRGGSVNFEQYTLIPHCNGTHTECVGHITHERISVRECLRDVFIPAVLLSVEGKGNGDVVIDRAELGRRLEVLTDERVTDRALIVRTLPNDESKLTRQYGDSVPPYFSTDAMEFIVESGFGHLLVDMPSIDRIFDQGKLLNHRMFWNVEPGSFETHADTRMCNTITELIYVPNEIQDGEYLLNLQIAPFVSDVGPSRPILFERFGRR